MRRRKGNIAKALVCAGLIILMLTFCSFRFICTVAAISFIIIGIKLLLCS